MKTNRSREVEPLPSRQLCSARALLLSAALLGAVGHSAGCDVTPAKAAIAHGREGGDGGAPDRDDPLATGDQRPLPGLVRLAPLRLRTAAARVGDDGPREMSGWENEPELEHCVPV